MSQDGAKPRLLYLVTEDWYFCSHRLPLARAAREVGFEVGVVTHEDRDGETIRSEGFKLIPLNMYRGQFRPLREIRTVYTLWRILRKERPALIHNVAIKPVILGTLAARSANVGVVINALAGLGYVFTSRQRRARFLRKLVEFAFRILFSSPAVRIIVQNSVDQKLIESLGVPPERIALIAGSGVDFSVFQERPEPTGPVVVAMVSRMLWDKGVGELVEAARLVRSEIDNVVIRLVGPMDPANPSTIPEATLMNWVREGVVEWTGPTREVPSVWSDAHIGVLPSYREGLPKSLLEAAACGRPLIATDVPGCRDVVVHEETGLLVPPKDPNALARAIIRLAKDPRLRSHLGNAARERVEQHFSVGKVVEQTLTLYRSILSTA